MQIAHYSHLSVRRYTYPYAIFNGLSGKAVAKRPRARFSCCTLTTDLGETFRLVLAALRSTIGDAKFREIEKTWVQEHQEQTVTTAEFVKFASDKSTKAIDPTDEAVTYHYDFAKPSGAAKITVTYDGQTASFTVKVTADAGNKSGNNPKQQASPVQNGNAVAVLATSMTTVVIASFGDRMLPLCGAGGSQVSCDAVAHIGRAFAHCLTGVPGLMCRHGGRRIPCRRRR